jgi:hypothetical protein
VLTILSRLKVLFPMIVQEYYDNEYGVPQFFIVGASADFEGWRTRSITDLNIVIRNLASRWPWTRSMYDGPNPYGQVCAAYCFLDNCNTRAAIDTSWVASDLKLDVERATGLYVSEGYYVVAAKLLDMKLRPTSDCKSFHLNLKMDDSYRDHVEAKYAARTSAAITSPADSQLMCV